MATKTLTISNIGSEITVENLTALFGLENDGSAKVNIVTTDAETMATIEVRDAIYNEVLKLNGLKFKGVDLRVVPEESTTDDATDQMETGATSPEEPPTISESEEEDPIFMVLDVRDHPHFNFPPVTETEVCDDLLIKHPNDPHLAVKTGWGRRLGTFVIESTDMKPYVNTSLTIRGKEIPLRPIFRKRRAERDSNEDAEEEAGEENNEKTFDPDTLKVRIFDAFEVRYRSISSEEFDNAFLEMGVDVIKPTLPEKCRDRRDVLNGNRYVIVKPIDEEGNKIDMGGRINVSNRTFKISYPGKLHFCTLCQVKHDKECPKRFRFEFLRNLRKGKTNGAKIYSNSELRLANPLALTTDIACMSGGGIGQICNLVPHDKHKHDEVIIHAGSNELRTESRQEFVYEVSTAAEKLHNLSTTIPVTIVTPPIDKDMPEVAARSKYMLDTFSKIDTISVVPLDAVDLDETRHPTEEGTLAIIEQINRAKGEKIILEGCRADVTVPVKYRQVQAVFKAGCRGCNNMTYTPSLCEGCKVAAEECDLTQINEIFEKIKDELYPPLDNGTNTAAMDIDKDKKRTLDENDGESPASKISRPGKN